MSAVLTVKDLVKEFPVRGSQAVVHAVGGVSLKVERAETLGLVGESGSGKTTTGRCILRLIEPTAGEILFKGQPISGIDIKKFRFLRPKMQMVFQEPYESLNPRMTAFQAIADPLQLWDKASKSDRSDRVKYLAEQVRLGKDRLDRYPHQLSGGDQQKVSIARAIATDPDFLVLDEPTSLLDPLAHGEIMDLLGELQVKFGFSYLFISHDLAAVHRICHRVAIMYLSRIVEEGPARDIFESPQHPYSQALIASVLFPDPSSKRQAFALRGEIPSPIDLPAGCYFYSRCPKATPKCRDTYPPFVNVATNHVVACFDVPGDGKGEQSRI